MQIAQALLLFFLLSTLFIDSSGRYVERRPTKGEDDLIVNTTSGAVSGLWIRPNVPRAFLGIPYANPPTGPLRFRPSSSIPPWSGVKQTTTFSPICIQPTGALWRPYPQSEDCLYLNIYSPVFSLSSHSSQPQLLPTMVWVHGGAFVTGTGADYEGTAIASQGVVVVTLNYRLGLFGYFQSKLIQAENPNFPTLGGMNGIGDQVLALKWVKENIARFGGDPNDITIFGESAGSLSVGLLVSSPLVPKNLFKKAIFESGSIVGPWGPYPLDFGLTLSAAVMTALNVTTLDELRMIPVAELLPHVMLSPSIDGYFYPESPVTIFNQSAFNIPPDGAVIVGTNTLDSVYEVPYYNGTLPQTEADLKNTLVKYFGTFADSILQIYSLNESPHPPKVLFQIMNRDTCVVCPTRLAVDSLSKNYPLYLYEYGYNPTEGDYNNLSNHGSELGIVWGNPVFPPYPYNQQLSNSMITFWTNFAKVGNPTTAGANCGLVWPEWNLRKEHIYFDAEIQIKSGYHDTICSFWDNYINMGYVEYVNVWEFCIVTKGA